MTTSRYDARSGFIALEGPDGSGKTTQAARLSDWLRAQGLDVVACRDPGGTALGDRLRSILLDRAASPMTMRAEMLLYMASRAQLVAEVIRPALDSGRIVVSDRYLLSNVVYQGAAGGLGEELVWRVGAAATGGLMPSLTLLIDVPLAVARSRTGTGRDRIEDRPDEYRLLVRDGFLAQAERYPAPIRIIDGSAGVEEVEARLRREAANALGLDPRP